MSINFVVKWADNTAELKKNLAGGLEQIEFTKAAVERLTRSLSGENAVKSANNWALALNNLGAAGGALAGVQKLTAAETDRATAAIDRAVTKYKLLGEAAPSALTDLSTALHKAKDANDALDASQKKSVESGTLLGSVFGQMTAALSVSSLINKATGALADLGRQAFANADALVSLSNKTGLSTETIQKMQFVAKQSGSDMQQFADAAFKMGVNISEGTAKAREGAQALGLDWQALRAASPDDQFNMVVAALEKMEDPQKRNAAAVGLFGKTAKEILPAIVDGYTKAASAATVAGDAQVRAVDAAGDAWDRFKTAQVAGLTQFLGSLILRHEAIATLTTDEREFVKQTALSSQEFEDWVIHANASTEAIAKFDAAIIKAAESKQKFGNVAGLGMAQMGLSAEVGPTQGDISFPATPKQAPSFTGNLKEAEAGFRALTAAKRDEIAAAVQLGTSNDKIINDLNLTEGVLALAKKAIEENKNALSKLAEEQKKYNESIASYNSTDGADYESILDKIGNTMYEGIAFDKARGKSTSDLVAAYKTTATVIEQVVKSEENYAAAVKATEKNIESSEAAGLEAAAAVSKAFAGPQLILKNLLISTGAVPISLHSILAPTQQVGQLMTDVTVTAKEHFDDLSDAITGDFTDIVNTMRSHGVQTREDLQRTADQFKSEYQAMLASGKFTTEQLIAAWQRYRDASEAASHSFSSSFGKALDELPGVMARALEGGGGLEAVLKASLVTIAGNLFGKGGVWAHEVSRQAQISAVAIQGALAVASSLAAPGSRGSNIANYAGQGAAIGTTIMPGYGTLVGAGVGAVVGALKVPDDEKAARDSFNAFKSQLEDLFDKTASFQLKTAVGADAWGKMVQEVSAAYIATGKTAEDALADINTAADHTRNNVDALPEDLKKINAVLQQTLNFGDLATASASNVGLIDKSFLILLNHAKELNGVTQSMKDFVSAQTTNAEAGIGSALSVGNDAYTKRLDILSQIDALAATEGKEEVQNQAKIADLRKKMVGADSTHYNAYLQQIYLLEGAQDSTTAKIDALNQSLGDQDSIIEAVGIHSQQAADAVSASLVGIIGSQVQAGKSFHDSVVAIGPSVDALTQQMVDAGYHGGAAFDFLRGQVALVNDSVAGPALTAVEGYAAGLVGLNNAGLLNEDMFAGLSGQIGQTRDALVAQGKDGGQVMAAMRGPLQTMWELEQKFGYTTDDSTQALIDQAVQQGIVGDKFKSVADQQLDATNRMADAIEGLAEVFGVLPKAAKDAASGISDELSKIKAPSITIPIRMTGDGSGNGDGSQPAFATEAYVRSPTLAMVGDVSGGEFVLKPSTIMSWLNGAAGAGAAAGAGVSQSSVAASMMLQAAKMMLSASTAWADGAQGSNASGLPVTPIIKPIDVGPVRDAFSDIDHDAKDMGSVIEEAARRAVDGSGSAGGIRRIPDGLQVAQLALKTTGDVAGTMGSRVYEASGSVRGFGGATRTEFGSLPTGAVKTFSGVVGGMSDGLKTVKTNTDGVASSADKASGSAKTFGVDFGSALDGVRTKSSDAGDGFVTLGGFVGRTTELADPFDSRFSGALDSVLTATGVTSGGFTALSGFVDKTSGHATPMASVFVSALDTVLSRTAATGSGFVDLSGVVDAQALAAQASLAGIVDPGLAGVEAGLLVDRAAWASWSAYAQSLIASIQAALSNVVFPTPSVPVPIPAPGPSGPQQPTPRQPTPPGQPTPPPPIFGPPKPPTPPPTTGGGGGLFPSYPGSGPTSSGGGGLFPTFPGTMTGGGGGLFPNYAMGSPSGNVTSDFDAIAASISDISNSGAQTRVDASTANDGTSGLVASKLDALVQATREQSGGTNIIVVHTGGQGTTDQIVDAVISKLPATVQRNPRGLRSDLLAALGQPVTTWTGA